MPSQSPREKAKAALKAFSKLPPTQADYDTILDELYHARNDRSRVLIAIAVLEQALEDVLRLHFRKMNKEEERRLFDFEASLGTLSNKIYMAYALGMIDRSDVRELNALREIRNAFAHSRRITDFDTPEVAAYCEFLKIPTDPPPPDGLQMTPRLKFIGAFVSYLGIFTGYQQRFSLARALKETRP